MGPLVFIEVELKKKERKKFKFNKYPKGRCELVKFRVGWKPASYWQKINTDSIAGFSLRGHFKRF